MMPSFEVYQINNSGKRVGRPVFVRAANAERAEIAGKVWLRILGRPVRHVRAWPYRPELDLEIRMWVKKNCAP